MSLRIISALLILFASGGSFAQDKSGSSDTLPLDLFLRHEQFQNVKLSPTGEFLAASIKVGEDTGALVILRRTDMQVTGTMKLQGRYQVLNFDWVNDERVVFSVAESSGSLSSPNATGELYATNWDGKKQMVLSGMRKGGGELGRIQNLKGEITFATLVSTMPRDEKNILVKIRRIGGVEGDFPTLEKMNVYTGARRVITKAPALNSNFVIDHKDVARFATGNDAEGFSKLFYRADDSSDWQMINDETKSELQIYPIGFNSNDTVAYLQTEEKSGPDSLVAFDVKSMKSTRLLRQETMDPRFYQFLPDEVTPFAVGYGTGLIDYMVIDDSLPEAKLLQGLKASFKTQNVSITSESKDGSQVIFHVWSDTNPGEFYHFDRETNKAAYLLASREWIDAKKMAPMRPIEIKARDGLALSGFLTVPKNSDGKNLPLIIHPHGGPFGVTDTWGFDGEVQLLANRGYAVLQLNFRGSGGRGREFVRKGYRQWGGTMQDDLTDATAWAIEEGITDKNRICIYGASYGAYASAMGVAKEPDLYKCAVGYVGVYDMDMMYTRGDIEDSLSGQSFLKQALGERDSKLSAVSPNKLVGKIKAPIFIITGEKDDRAHPDHSRALRDALAKAGKPYEWLSFPQEGHGFYRLEHNVELYSKMMAFFDKYIGASAAKE